MQMEIFDRLTSEFGGHISFRERRLGIIQVIAPLFHEDGDMIDIFIDAPSGSELRISDHGMTMMRLSYSYDVDTPTKNKILSRILSENGIREERGRLYMDGITTERLYPALLQFAQTVAKVSNMQVFKHEVIRRLFYETLNDFVETSLTRYGPIPHFLPIESKDDLEVDWNFPLRPKSIYLYGVRDNAKARLAALMCREFQIIRIPFRSVIVHEDFENGLSRKDQTRITNVADKQFTSLADFQTNAEEYFNREAESARLN